MRYSLFTVFLGLLTLAFANLSCNPKRSEKPMTPPSAAVDMQSPKADLPPASPEAPAVKPGAVEPDPGTAAAETDPDLESPGGLKADLTCAADDECTFAPRHPCACDGCPARPAAASNKKSAQLRLDYYARARFDCKPCSGPTCPPRGASVACRAGRCTVLE
jgi:hypothetical protein